MNRTDVITDCQKRLIRNGHKIAITGKMDDATLGAIYAELHGYEVVDGEDAESDGEASD